MWLSGLSAGLKTKGSHVRFPVRAHAWVVGQVPSRGRAREATTHGWFSPSLPPIPFLKINKILNKNNYQEHGSMLTFLGENLLHSKKKLIAEYIEIPLDSHFARF